jgi:hypothetical protein
MGYTIEAFVAREELLLEAASSFQNAVIVSLPQGFALLLNTDEFHDELWNQESGKAQTYEEFRKLSPELVAFALQASSNGPIAYVEAEFFGGVGTQASTVWESRAVRMRPYYVDTEHDDVKLQKMPINRALGLLGVERANHLDEFDALGLGRHRHTKQWIEHD